jgi:hypothetical protein
MEELNLYQKKQTRSYCDSDKIQDIVEAAGKDLLIQWNIRYNNFCNDRRFYTFWKKDDAKPDLIISYNDKPALLDWKGKLSIGWFASEHTIKSYERLQKILNIPILICFITIDESEYISERRFAVINSHLYMENKKQSDGNKTVMFKDELPIFNKENMLKYIFDLNNDFDQ